MIEIRKIPTTDGHRIDHFIQLVPVRTLEELALVLAAKKKKLSVYAQIHPSYLFLSDVFSSSAKTCAAFWEAVHDETVDTIGVGCFSHSIQSECCWTALYFPLLLNAYHEKNLSLEQIVSLTHIRAQEIFHLPLHDDVVLVDMNKRKTIQASHSDDKTLEGWPRYTILAGKSFDLENLWNQEKERNAIL